MQRLEPPDSHRLRAAIGWMELGCRAEAEAELEAIPAARKLLLRAPDRASGWLNQAYALRRAACGGLQQARDALLPAADKFPQEPTIPYNLSCYACQLHQLEEARVWFQRALNAGDRETIKRMALDDPDLKPLWAEIRQL